MEKTIDSVSQKECSGCGACVQKCPKKAITMKENAEGFLYPKINYEKCINCGLCKKTCPSLNYRVEENKDYPKAYAVKNKNIKDVLNSSSGGVFILLAKYVIDKKGVVYGAAYDENNNIKHIAVDSQKDLIKLQGSKYVQSDTTAIYNDVKKNLSDKKLVLFSGTPCQIKGLKNFLGKNFDNLLTCDLVCHGVPSQKLFKKYLTYLEKKYHKTVKKFDFRNKGKKGWGLTAKVTFDDNSKKYINSDFDPYYSNFLNCNTYRESCYNCKFASTKREADITLADYWGILSIHNNFYDKKGVSLILINSQTGEETINKLKDNIYIQETDLNYAITKNKNLKESSRRPEKRNEIYQKIDDLPAEEFIKHSLTYKITPKKIIKVFIPNTLKKYIMKIKVVIK